MTKKKNVCRTVLESTWLDRLSVEGRKYPVLRWQIKLEWIESLLYTAVKMTTSILKDGTE